MGDYRERLETIALARRAVRRMHRVRRFPENTDSASRHVALMAAALSQYGEYTMLAEEPRHCAASLALTVAALWSARTEIARLKQRLARASSQTGSRSAGAPNA